MVGTIAGDIIGSIHEYTTNKSLDFPLFVPDSEFTDDTVSAAMNLIEVGS